MNENLEKPSFKEIVLLNIQQLTNFPYIEKDFDALSDYGLLCKVVEKMNEVITNNNIQNESINALYDAFLGLKNYIDNYFDNLDVQDEINNKLDEMALNGELQQILQNQYHEINNSITEFENEINDVIAIQNNKINSLHNFAPIVVNNTSQMTDTTKVYLLTTDNNWYYYNGTTWTIGGAYNSQPIADGSIDILKFDELLQNGFDMNYDLCEELENPYQGYVNDVGGSVVITQTQPATISYKYYIIPLELGEIYSYTGKNNDSARGLIVADNDDNVILKSTGSGINNITFKVNENNLKAYVGAYIRDEFESAVNYEFYYFNESNVLRKLNSITTKITQNNTASLVQTMNQRACFAFTNNAILKLQATSSSYATYMYSCKKGEKFRITYCDYYLVKGFYVTDKSYISKVLGESTSDPSTIEWTATFDGYIFLTKIPDFTPSIIKLIDGIDVNTDDIYSILKGKTIAYDGDSITQSRINQGNQSNGGAYPKLIADLTDSYYQNQATGGATLSYKDGSTNCICRRLTNLPVADMYVFSGGINDMWDNRPLGTITSNYTDEVNDTTITGALEKIFRYALTNFVGKPILYVITQKVRNPYYNGGGYNQFDLHDRIVEVCNKYSIPYYDAFNESGLNGWNTAQSNAYLNANSQGTSDGTHPNENGYLKYYVPQIISLLNTNILK